MLFLVDNALAVYNSDGSVLVNAVHELRLTYEDDNGYIVDNATCSWTVEQPNGTIFIDNQTWTVVPRNGSVVAYYKYSFTPTIVGYYHAVVTCTYAGDNPPTINRDVSFIVSEATLTTQDLKDLKDTIINEVSYGGGSITLGYGHSYNYTMSISDDGSKCIIEYLNLDGDLTIDFYGWTSLQKDSEEPNVLKTRKYLTKYQSYEYQIENPYIDNEVYCNLKIVYNDNENDSILIQHEFTYNQLSGKWEVSKGRVFSNKVWDIILFVITGVVFIAIMGLITWKLAGRVKKHV